MASFTTRVNIQPIESIHNSHDYLNCFMVLTASWYPTSAHTCMSRPLYSPECFTVSNYCRYTDLGSRGYFDIERCSCLHMPWQHSCCVFCKIWQQSHSMSLSMGAWNFHQIKIMIEISLVKCVPCCVITHHTYWDQSDQLWQAVMDVCLTCLPPRQSPGAHFMNDFAIIIQIRWKFHSAFIQVAI